MKQKQDFKKILHNAKLKITNQRLAVLRTLGEITHPKKAQEIFRRLKKYKIDLVTLYRTLASFEKNGLVKRVDLHKDAVYYELNLDHHHHHHHHIVCTGCGKLEDFETCDMDRLTKKIISKALNFKNVREHILELFGVCNVCANKNT